MLRRLPLLAVVLALLLAACGSGRGAGPAAPDALTDEDRADLAFFAQAGFLDVQGLPFVEVRTGGWREADGEVHLYTARGFLREIRVDGTIEVLTGELFPVVWRLTEGDVPPEKEISYRTLDLAEAVRERPAGREPTFASLFEEPEARRYAERFGSRARRAALALACHRQGLGAEAHDLLESARQKKDGASGERDKRPLRESLYESLSLDVIWRAVVAFGEAAVPREELRRVFGAHLATFPKSEHAERSAYVVEMLEQMLAEDVEHARDAKPLAEMTRAEQIDELIFRLRDQNGHQMMQPGGPSVFVLPDYGDDSPAHRLAAFGYDAVPALLDALDDERFTRTVGFWRNFHYSHHIVRVGDAAAEVLSKLTGQYFSRGADNKKVSREERNERWRAWWSTLSEIGIDAGLAAEVRQGGGTAWSAAERLVARNPKAALPALLEGITNAEDGHARSSLVAIVAQVPGEAQLEFMQRELRERHGLHDRLRAARWLDRHGQPEGFQTVQGLWAAALAQEAPDSQAIVPLAICLVLLGTEEAMRTLIAGLADLDVAMRGRALDALPLSAARSDGRAPLEPAAGRLLVDCLAQSLDDESELHPGDWVRHAPDADTVRICEIAAMRLAYFLYDEGVRYTQAAFRGDRDRQIHAIRNHWRAKRGLELLPELEPPDLPGLGNRVREVRVLPAGTSPGPAAAAACTALIDRDLTAASFAAVVDLAVGERPEGSPGIEALLWRPDDGTGIALTLTVLTSVDPEQLRLGSWERAIRLRCGRAEKLNESRDWTDPFGEQPPPDPVPAPALAEYGGFVEELDRALARPFDLAIRAQISVRQPLR